MLKLLQIPVSRLEYAVIEDGMLEMLGMWQKLRPDLKTDEDKVDKLNHVPENQNKPTSWLNYASRLDADLRTVFLS